MKIQKRIKVAYSVGKIKILSKISSRLAADELFELFCTPFLETQNVKSEIFKKYQPLSITFQNKMVYGYSCGAGKKTALILHGFSSCSHKFDNYVDDLISEGYKVLAFDAPAHGKSEGKTINALEYRDMILNIIKEFGRPDAYICHSFGGLAVMLAHELIEHNEKTKIVLIAPATETTSAINQAFRLASLKSINLKNALYKKIEKVSGYSPEWFSIRRAIKNVKASILWLHDEFDKITPALDAKKVQEDNPPNVEFVFTQGLGHGRIYKNKLVQKRIIDFLK